MKAAEIVKRLESEARNLKEWKAKGGQEFGHN